MLKILKNFLKMELEYADRQKKFWKNPVFKCPISAPETEIMLPFFDDNYHNAINCCGGNYLGLAPIENGLDTNCGGSPLIGGYSEEHKKLEETIAGIYGGDPIVFLNVTVAVQGFFQAVTRPMYKITKGKIIDTILFDSLNHSCLMETLRLAEVTYRRRYKHSDMDDLEKMLRKYSGHDRRTIILTDGVFSMEGDIAPLDKIVDLASKYHAAVVVDDAHATGVLGKTGKGTCEYFGLKGENEPIQIVSFSKAIGALGAAIIIDEDIKDFLRRNCRNYIFCGTLSSQHAFETKELIKKAFIDSHYREKLLENANYLRTELKKLGYKVSGDMSIIPVHIGDPKNGSDIHAKDNEIAQGICYDLFMEYGIYCRAIEYPVVPAALLRFTLNSLHTREQIDRIINSLSVLGKKYNII